MPALLGSTAGRTTFAARNMPRPNCALADSGLRARLWYGYAQDLAATAPMDFKDIQRVQVQLQGADYARIDLGLAIRGPERTEAAIWEQEFAFARAQSLPISTHIAVSRKMQEKKAIQQLANRGLLSPAVQLVHATHADQEDMASIGRSGASVCITPLTEMRMGYGLPPVAALQRTKLPVTLGIDTPWCWGAMPTRSCSCRPA